MDHSTGPWIWGAAATSCWYDAYLSTNAVAVALYNAGEHKVADNALAALADIVPARPSQAPETLTFGGLVEALDQVCNERGWPAAAHPAPVLAIVGRERVKWQRMRSWPEFYNPWLSIAGYCAERVYRDEEVDLDRFLDQFQAPNGSIANSPAASAFFLLETERRGQAIVPERGARLRQYIHSRTPESIGYLDHVPHFVTAWSVMFENEVEHPLAHSHPAIAELCRELAHPSGLLCTVGATTIPGDTDSTACAMIAARIMERPTPATSSLDRMFDASEGAYRTFYFEHDLSLTTNIHMAGLLDLDGDRDRLAMLLAWLDRQTAHENTTCKWHLSPVYTMGEMARVLASVDHPVARSLAAVAARRLLNTQNGDGGWGHHGSTTEETAYSVLGVASVMRHGLVTPDISPALAQAHMFLTTRNPELTPLWLGKTLYCVQPLVPILRTVATQRLEQL